MSSFELNSRLSQRISTANFLVEGEETWETPSLALARVNSIGGFARPLPKDEVKINRGTTPFVNCALASNALGNGGVSTYVDEYFGGYVSSVTTELVGVRRRYRCTAQDYNILPLQILVTKSYADKTEQQIIDDLFSTYLSEVYTSPYVESSGATISINWTRETLNEALEQLAEIFGKEWRIDHAKNLHYFIPVTTEAPFALSDEPTEILTSKISYSNFEHVEDASKIINKVTVVGDDSIPVVVTRTSPDSYAKYGRWFEDKIVDGNIDTEAWAQLVGDAKLAEAAFAKVRGRMTMAQAGLKVGQKVRVINRPRDIDAYYLIQAVRLTILGGLTLEVTINYGDYSLDLTELLRKMSKEERRES